MACIFSPFDCLQTFEVLRGVCVVFCTTLKINIFRLRTCTYAFSEYSSKRFQQTLLMKTVLSEVDFWNVKLWVIIIESERGVGTSRHRFPCRHCACSLKARARSADKPKFVPLLEILHGSARGALCFCRHQQKHSNACLLKASAAIQWICRN